SAPSTTSRPPSFLSSRAMRRIVARRVPRRDATLLARSGEGDEAKRPCRSEREGHDDVERGEPRHRLRTLGGKEVNHRTHVGEDEVEPDDVDARLVKAVPP